MQPVARYDHNGPEPPAYVPAEQARAVINAARRTRDRLRLETLWQTGARERGARRAPGRYP